MKALKLLAAITITCLFSFASCKKNVDNQVADPHNRDISTLSLPDLKTTIGGNWKLVYTWSFYAGKKDYVNTYINFYNFADSIKWIENNVETLRSKATYTKGTSIYSSTDSVYTIQYIDNRYGNLTRFWGADKIKNDTLILRDNQQTNPTSYYLIK